VILERVVRRVTPRNAIEALADEIPVGLGVSLGLFLSLGALLWPVALVAIFRR
jgi:hypothetical protein